MRIIAANWILVWFFQESETPQLSAKLKFRKNILNWIWIHRIQV